MFRWLFTNTTTSRSFDAPSETQSARDDRKTLQHGENYLLFELIVSEVEMVIVKFETDQEQKREEERKIQRKPDYSWLISDKKLRPLKHLTIQERNRIENACERLKPSEWSETIDNWKSRVENPKFRDEIIDQFVLSTHETIQSRKHESTMSDVLKKFTNGQKINQVGHSDNVVPDTARSITQLSFIELQDMV